MQTETAVNLRRVHDDLYALGWRNVSDAAGSHLFLTLPDAAADHRPTLLVKTQGEVIFAAQERDRDTGEWRASDHGYPITARVMMDTLAVLQRYGIS